MTSPALDARIQPHDNNPRLTDYLHTSLISIELEVSSRKRLFEEIANVVSKDSLPQEAHLMVPLTAKCVLDTLNERERLGSTGIGHGIILPHGRLEHLTEPVILVVRLKTPIECDVPDAVPVWLAVCLLVPKNAHEAHLNLLSQLAKHLNDDAFVSAVKEAKTSDEIMRLFSCA